MEETKVKHLKFTPEIYAEIEQNFTDTDLSKSAKCDLYDAIFAYSFWGKMPENPSILFKYIKVLIDRNYLIENRGVQKGTHFRKKDKTESEV